MIPHISGSSDPRMNSVATWRLSTYEHPVGK